METVVIDGLKNKRKFRLLTPKDPKSISLSERIVYSYLAYRARYEKAATQAEIADQTGLERGRTVARAVIGLIQRGLVERREAGLVAVEDNDVFLKLDQGEHWSQRYAYLWYYPVTNGLTTAENLLLWTLHSLGGRPQNKVGLANLTGLKRDYIVKWIKKLIERGALRKPDKGRYTIGTPDPSWFIDRPIARMTETERRVRKWLTTAEIPQYEHSKLVKALLPMPDPRSVIKRAYVGHKEWSKQVGAKEFPCTKRLWKEIDKHTKRG